MSNQYRSRNAADVLRDLHTYVAAPLLDVDALSDQQVRAELSRRGISPGPSFRAIHDLLEEKAAQAELAAAKQRRLGRLASIKPSRPSFGSIRGEVKALIQRLTPQTASVYWSKFESAEEEDLQSLYDDLQDLQDKPSDPSDDATA